MANVTRKANPVIYVQEDPKDSARYLIIAQADYEFPDTGEAGRLQVKASKLKTAVDAQTWGAIVTDAKTALKSDLEALRGLTHVVAEED